MRTTALATLLATTTLLTGTAAAGHRDDPGYLARRLVEDTRCIYQYTRDHFRHVSGYWHMRRDAYDIYRLGTEVGRDVRHGLRRPHAIAKDMRHLEYLLEEFEERIDDCVDRYGYGRRSPLHRDRVRRLERAVDHADDVNDDLQDIVEEYTEHDGRRRHDRRRGRPDFDFDRSPRSRRDFRGGPPRGRGRSPSTSGFSIGRGGRTLFSLSFD